MVILHITSTRAGLIGGVPAAVPRAVCAQSRFASVLSVNTKDKEWEGGFSLDCLSAPFSHPDLVVFHEVYKFEYIGIARTLRERGVPYVVAPHGCLSRYAQRKKRVKKLAANILFFHSFLRGARAIQYLSEHERKLSAFSRLPAFVAGGGVALPDVGVREERTGDVRLVYIGRLDIRIKGLDLLLRAIARARAALAEHHVVVEIYGPDEDGAHARLHKRIMRLGIGHLVRVGGGKFGEEKAQILRGADAFIQCSRTEGLPLGPLEALSWGLPCLLTAGVGLGGSVLDAGAGDTCDTSVRGIAEMLERFLEGYPQKAPAFRAAARALAARFDEAVAAEGAVACYARVTGEKR